MKKMTPPATTERKHQLTTAALWAVAGLTLIAFLAVMFFAAGTSSQTQAGAAKSAPGITPAAARLLQLDVLSAPLNDAPDFTLTDQGGTRVRLSQYLGKSVVLSFNDDECPDLCTLLAQDVTQANHDLGEAAADVVFLSVNANSLHPAVADVKAWTNTHGLASEPNWVFATGNPKQLATVAARYHVPESIDPTTHDVIHGSELFFIDTAGKEAAIGQFGTESANTALFAHSMAQMALNLVPGRAGTPVGGAAPSDGAATDPAELGQKASGFSLPRLGDPEQKISLAGTKGEYTVVNFWASTCSACIQEMPAVQKAHDDLGASVAFLGIDVADLAQPAATLAARSGTTYPLLSDAQGATAGAYRITGLPFTAVIAPDGTLLVRHPGTFTAKQLEYVINGLQNEPR